MNWFLRPGATSDSLTDLAQHSESKTPYWKSKSFLLNGQVPVMCLKMAQEQKVDEISRLIVEKLNLQDGRTLEEAISSLDLTGGLEGALEAASTQLGLQLGTTDITQTIIAFASYTALATVFEIAGTSVSLAGFNATGTFLK